MHLEYFERCSLENQFISSYHFYIVCCQQLPHFKVTCPMLENQAFCIMFVIVNHYHLLQ